MCLLLTAQGSVLLPAEGSVTAAAGAGRSGSAVVPLAPKYGLPCDKLVWWTTTVMPSAAQGGLGWWRGQGQVGSAYSDNSSSGQMNQFEFNVSYWY
eukprot:COSAG06_NODE_335_length_17284_cov_12.707594_9_plen_96_part_00